ncbi:MAG: M48 family metallopeptidase [Thiobacillus sp.]|nr:M48 family metallopeptidase [Thiobacillus sp.]
MARYALLAAMLFGLSGCGPSGQPGTHMFLVSRDMAEALGQDNYTATLDRARSGNALDSDPDQVRLVTEIATHLVEEAKRRYPVGRDWQWEIHVIGSDQVNAFCMPGGKMAVLSGLLETTGMDPDQIAMVVGHEISHALLEHTRASLSRDWLLQGGMWIVSKSLKMGALRNQSALENLNTVLLPMHRDLEREADALGLDLMASAGFDPGQGIRFWQNALAKRGEVGRGDRHLEAFMSTHPADAERLARLGELARQWHRPEAKP